MKPIIYLLITSICLTEAAQSQKVNFGLTVGSSFSNYKSTFQSVSITSKYRVGYVVGVLADIEIGKIMSFQPAFNYVQKGGKLKTSDFKDHLIMHYFEIPLNIAFKFPVRKSKIIIGGGPALSFGMYGTDEWEAQGQSGKEKIKFGSGINKDFKIFEGGINVLTGFISDDGLIISLNYSAGLTNIINSRDIPDGEFRTRYFGFKIGQMLSHRYFNRGRK